MRFNIELQVQTDVDLTETDMLEYVQSVFSMETEFEFPNGHMVNFTDRIVHDVAEVPDVAT